MAAPISTQSSGARGPHIAGVKAHAGTAIGPEQMQRLRRCMNQQGIAKIYLRISVTPQNQILLILGAHIQQIRLS
jgi:hypothetical protein